MATGCSCDDPELVAVNDRNMAPVYVSGNPYSRYCTNCGRRYFCADSFWENSDDKHVIPDGEDEPVPFDEYEAENAFECPADGCGTVHFGYPDQCDACGQTYKWEDN
jgi:hypothetical protein